MTLHLSLPVAVRHSRPSDTFATRQVDRNSLGAAASPLVAMDHYRMSAPTFAPHPHAGFAAVAYVFEDSAGGLRNRDSLGHDFVVGPGEVVWTQAASGVIHEESPAVTGREVHGLQLFINLKRANKDRAPAVFRLERDQVAEWRSPEGDRVRVVAGAFGVLRSAIEPVEPFQLLDVALQTRIALDVPAGWNAVIYVVSGSVRASADGQDRLVDAESAITVHGDGGRLTLEASAPAHLIVLSGPENQEPIATYGPFIMNDQAQLIAAVERFKAGQMGHLADR
jgi:redox-sensitive bicupin YhaK (pirin superfamily)